MLDINLDIKGDLDTINELAKEVKALSNLVSKEAQVGIFEGKSDRDDGKSNAEIGLAHEFGVPQKGLPQRSFLRQPVIDGSFQALLNNKDIELDGKLLSELATTYLKSVKEEFESNGKGAWAGLSDSTSRKKNKNRDQILRDTKQLYKSLSKRVVKK